jgi:hypothetical protein
MYPTGHLCAGGRSERMIELKPCKLKLRCHGCNRTKDVTNVKISGGWLIHDLDLCSPCATILEDGLAAIRGGAIYVRNSKVTMDASRQQNTP